MAYEKQNFTDGQTLKAEHLNHMEEGIAKAHEQSGGGVVIDLLWQNNNAIDSDDCLISFEGGSLDVGCSDYDFVELVLLAGTENAITAKIPAGVIGTRVSNVTFSQTEIREFYRACEVDWEDGIVYIPNCIMIGTSLDGQGGGSSTMNDCLVPYRIYGIKGVNDAR